MAAEVITNMSGEIWWVTKVVVPLVGVAVASVIIPLILHKLKYKREREERLFEARKEAYKEYFKKFESASENVGDQYDHFSKVVMPEKFMELMKSDGSPEAVAEFSDTVGEFPHKIQDGYRKASAEITGLQIICSNKLFTMTEEFEEKFRKMLGMTSEWLEELNQTMVMPDMETSKANEMKALGEEIGVLKKKIVSQMREEIGSNV